jgi:hypothetical protein
MRSMSYEAPYYTIFCKFLSLLPSEFEHKMKGRQTTFFPDVCWRLLPPPLVGIPKTCCVSGRLSLLYVSELITPHDVVCGSSLCLRCVQSSDRRAVSAIQTLILRYVTHVLKVICITVESGHCIG